MGAVADNGGRERGVYRDMETGMKYCKCKKPMPFLREDNLLVCEKCAEPIREKKRKKK